VHAALGMAKAAAAGTVEAIPAALYELPLREARDQFERAYLEYHLKRTGGNVAEVAQIVEMERTHLYRKLKGLGIDIKGVKDG
jgi:two-component system, NtrC family, nitrogen regulation response regulator NtrX